MSTHDVIETPRHSVSVAAAIFDDSGENVLLIKRRDNGEWEPPGGVLELDETIEEGLRREVREESGVEVEVGPLTGVYKNMKRGIVALVFRCDAMSPPVLATDESLAVQWKPVQDVDNLLSQSFAQRVRDAHHNAQVAIRAHDGS
ncbi:NUDIX hydrolase [Terrabacter carboxydivorans]|uniref:NUDIX domain-containing protein n=1 Tax=Terrabacter carboxydivorans TaxID=619730 RepID=A0ABN3L0E7_9MICO